MIYSIARSLLFRLDAESAHHFTLRALKALHGLGLLPARKPGGEPVTVMGLSFPNAVGLAAGLDKNGEYIDALAALGFGFIEIGSVTPRPQPGNPKPRLFRLVEAEAIINRMGFNNMGVDYLLENVRKSSYRGILGINIGKNFDTPIENALDDYLVCLRKVYPHAGYVAVNISSPNTKNLRQLQQEKEFAHLVSSLKAEQLKLAAEHGKYVPLAIKIAPDLEDDEIDSICAVLLAQKMDAVIATNTTLSREGALGPHSQETGGMSGKPLFSRSNQVISRLAKNLQGKIPIIGVGGIMSGEDAIAKIACGAKLVQIYSGLIYRGPQLVVEAVRRLQGK